MRIQLAAFLLTLMTACGGPSVLVVPSASSVSTIEVSDLSDDALARVVRDRGVIEGVVHIVEKNNEGWSGFIGTFPTPQGRAVLVGEDESTLFIIWFGAGWIGARSHRGGYQRNVLWNLSPEMQGELGRLLGWSMERGSFSDASRSFPGRPGK